MDIAFFKLGQEAKKVKKSLLALSVISFFVAYHKIFPTKISTIGLDLQGSETAIGWLLLFVTLYFFVIFIIEIYLIISHYLIPLNVRKSNQDLTGSIGLAKNDILQELNYGEIEASHCGSITDELREIESKENKSKQVIKANFSKKLFVVRFIADIAFPIVFSMISIIYLGYQLSKLD
jgi:hypothetical protein